MRVRLWKRTFVEIENGRLTQLNDYKKEKTSSVIFEFNGRGKERSCKGRCVYTLHTPLSVFVFLRTPLFTHLHKSEINPL